MPYKTIIAICILSILTMSCSLKRPPQSITVLVKIEQCEGAKCDWSVQYQYDDRRKEVFEQNKPEFRFPDHDPRIHPDPTPQPIAIGYTKSDRIKPTPEGQDNNAREKLLRGPSVILAPESSIMKYNNSGKLEKEEWDTYGKQVIDRYYLYHYNKDNNLIKKQLFVLPENRHIHKRDIYIEYDGDGKLSKEIFNTGQTRYYNAKGQLIKIEWKNDEDSFHDSSTIFYYKSDQLIREEEYQYGEIFKTKYKYDKNGRIIEVNDSDETLKYEYDKEGKLIRKDEIDDEGSIITYYHYDEVGHRGRC